MIRIHNVTKGQPNSTRVSINTKWGGTSGYPIHFDLGPDEMLDIPRENFHDYHPAVKQNVAEYAANAILRVYEINSSHKYQDKGNKSQYSLDYLITAPDALALAHALTIATELHTLLNNHFAAMLFHNATTAVLGAALPTDLASLIIWITAAQTAYETNHRPDAGAHPFIDSVNTLALGAPIDLATSISTLRELFRAFHSHRMWVGTLSELDIPGILSY